LRLKNKRAVTTALLSGGSQVIVWFDLWEFYGNSLIKKYQIIAWNVLGGRTQNEYILIGII
jgi:hypothetical protein